jgi:uncharacterized protein (TIGR01777 family)
MKIAVTGASGLIGSELIAVLAAKGHAVVCLVRRPAVAPDESAWDPLAGGVDAGLLATCDAIIHLAGANVADGRWTARRRREIRDSRVSGLRTLTEALGRCRRRPAVLISASATGYYGDRGETLLDESSPSGTGFLARVCREWEAGLAPAAALGMRTVAVRLGVVLSGRGGALGRMTPWFRLGLGGCLGDGRQWMSWIAMADLTEIFQWALVREAVHGPINAVAPQAVRNSSFTQALARELHRPAVLRAPGWALRARFGRMADEALLASTRTVPRCLEELRFPFRFPDLQPALQQLLCPCE